MANMEVSGWGSLIALAIGLLWMYLEKRYRQRSLSFPFSSFQWLLPKQEASVRLQTAALLPWLYRLGLLSALFALANPQFFTKKVLGDSQLAKPVPTEGIAIYLVVDHSGSMAQNVQYWTEQGLVTISKMDLLKKLTTAFIAGNQREGLKGRANDLLGLIDFARVPTVLSPLTLDHNLVIKKLNAIEVVQDNEHNGTAIGYAIYKTVSLIAATRHFAQQIEQQNLKPPYTIKSAIIVLLTDGIQEPNPLDQGKRLRNIDIPDAGQYAKEEKVRLYIVNVDPNFLKSEFDPHRNQMQRVAESTGGKLFVMDGSQTLGQIYSRIDQIEKSQLIDPKALQPNSSISKADLPHLYQKHAIAPYLLMFAALCLIVASLLQHTYSRVLP